MREQFPFPWVDVMLKKKKKVCLTPQIRLRAHASNKEHCNLGVLRINGVNERLKIPFKTCDYKI